MAPDWTRTCNNGTATSPTVSNYDTATFHPTYNNEVNESAEAETERLAEIDRLEVMMHQRGVHDTSKHARQHREVKLARLAPVKHKKPHMNKKVIR